jgi:membrane peptidoglycan carboxypeptidase
MSTDPRPLRIFISYRRSDTAASALSIFESLAERFGDDQVFYDVDTIAPGSDFRDVIAEALDQSDVLLAVIGPRWLARSGLGTRRLHRRDDYVRLELAGALERGVQVIPVLVEEAAMPSPQDLPHELRDFAGRNAFVLAGGRRWRTDVQTLVDVVAQCPVRSPRPAPTPTASDRDSEGRASPTSHRAADDVEAPRGFVGRLLDWLRRDPRNKRRAARVLIASALGLAILSPAVAFLVGWLMFDVPPADAAAVAQAATFRYADGSPLATTRPGNVNRTFVPIERVPEHVRHAVLAAEDPSFYANPGFDFGALLSGGEETITQQYVQDLAGGSPTTLWRRYEQLVLAVKITQEQTKDQILGNYLNVVYFGRGAYGIQAASQAYFGKDVEDLDVGEAAMLAAAIKSPSRWDTEEDRAEGQPRWNFVLDGMVAQGWLPTADRATQTFPQVQDRQQRQVGTSIPGDAAGHIYKLAMDELTAQGISEQEINTDGIEVDLTIDPKRQQQAVDATTRMLKGQPPNLRSALVSIDPTTGAILAYDGGDNGAATDYAQTMRRPGSSFAPFVLAAAMQDTRQHVGLGSVYDGSSPQNFLGVQVTNSGGVSYAQCTVATAMTKSVDTVFYKMGIDTGPQRVVDAAHEAGIPADELPSPTAGIALGDKEVRPLDMAAAFATFAADGIRHDPHVITKVTAADGRVLFNRGRSSGEQTMPQQVARNVTESMKDVSSTVGIALAEGRAQAGKTASVADTQIAGQNTDAWTIGYTPSASTAVWVGTDTDAPLLTADGRRVLGRTLPGLIWQAFMEAALQGAPAEQFSPFVPLGTPS